MKREAKEDKSLLVNISDPSCLSLGLIVIRTQEEWRTGAAAAENKRKKHSDGVYDASNIKLTFLLASPAHITMTTSPYIISDVKDSTRCFFKHRISLEAQYKLTPSGALTCKH